jgi:hypothetical protein
LGPPDLRQIKAGQKLELSVPKDGLVIAEIVVNNGRRPPTSPQEQRALP